MKVVWVMEQRVDSRDKEGGPTRRLHRIINPIQLRPQRNLRQKRRFNLQFSRSQLLIQTVLAPQKRRQPDIKVIEPGWWESEFRDKSSESLVSIHSSYVIRMVCWLGVGGTEEDGVGGLPLEENAHPVGA